PTDLLPFDLFFRANRASQRSKRKRRMAKPNHGMRCLLLLHPLLGTLRGAKLVEFLDHLVGPSAVNFPWRVLLLPQHHMAPLVDQVSKLGFVGHLLAHL